MYEYLKGTLSQISDRAIVVECHGVGYLLKTTESTCQSLYTALNTEVMIYTALIVKEDSHTLVGFKEKEERELFFVLQSISGVGTKTALQILSSIDRASLSTAVHTKNPTVLTAIPGIGRKSAERLMMELKDKLPKINVSSGQADALQALIKLGYPAQKAQKALQEVKTATKSLDQIIKEALSLI